MKKFNGIVNDPVFEAKERTGFFNSFFIKLIRDERDLPFVHLCLVMSFTLIPSAIILYLHLLDGIWWYLHALGHVALFMYFLGPFTLMLHNTSHRIFFKQGLANNFIPWVLGPFMGQSPMLYFSHHIGMHHAEANMPEDKSSTMRYQRDSFIDFMRYCGRFILIGILDLIAYFNKKTGKQRRHFLWLTYRGELLYFAMWIGLCFVDWQSTIFVFILPLLLIRFLMMIGNWAQHAFVSQEFPDNDYQNSITCINSGYNKTCFNDGYHIGHHANPSMHWTDMPTDFINNQEKYINNQSVVFEGLDYNQIWFYLVTKQYHKLAANFVDLGNQFESDEAIIDLLRARTQKFPPNKVVSSFVA